ncbi:hypothetical protein SUGI_0337140 [Cryptomeria japonica]|nr:hypothetical protein SUGI_0337140 [Cryptomeria japonica]
MSRRRPAFKGPRPFPRNSYPETCPRGTLRSRRMRESDWIGRLTTSTGDGGIRRRGKWAGLRMGLWVPWGLFSASLSALLWSGSNWSFVFISITAPPATDINEWGWNWGLGFACLPSKWGRREGRRDDQLPGMVEVERPFIHCIGRKEGRKEVMGEGIAVWLEGVPLARRRTRLHSPQPGFPWLHNFPRTSNCRSNCARGDVIFGEVFVDYKLWGLLSGSRSFGRLWLHQVMPDQASFPPTLSQNKHHGGAPSHFSQGE